MSARLQRFVVYSAFVLTASVGYAADSITHQITLPPGETWCDDSMIYGLFDQINAFRAQNGVPALKMDPLGMKDAEMRAVQFIAYMAANPPGSPGFNPHQGYDTTAASLGYNIISENLAYLTANPVYIVYAAWQDPLHIAAMLARDANIAGVSCVYSADGTPYWTYEPGCSADVCGQLPPAPAPVLDTEELAFLTLINDYRAQNGAGPLQVSVALENAAKWMSNDMATKNYADHTDSLGRSAGTRLAAFGYPYSPWGENIAGGYPGAQNAFNQWLNACDPDASGNCTYAHRKNMLNASFKVIGIGRAYNANSTYGWYWTTDFGGYVDAIINPNPNPTPTPAPTIAYFTAAPSSITAGQSATLSWSVSGANSISIDNGIGDVSNVTSKVVSPARTTIYKLTALNSGGASSAVVTITVTSASDTQPPTAPTLVSAVAKSSTQVALAWTGSTDNVGVAGYQVIRNGLVIASVPGSVLTYSDASARANTSYTYIVRAYDAAGNYSGASNSVQVTTPASIASDNCPAPATGAFTGCYYNNTTLTGSPVFIRTDSQINFEWAYRPPDPSVTPGNFSVRWRGNFSFDAGTYTFSAIVSDGMRVYIDGNIVLDQWRDQPAYMYTIFQTLSQGNHLVTVEYYERTGWPAAHLSWQKSSPVVRVPVISSFNAAPSSITAGQSATLSWSVSGASSISIDNGIGDVSNVPSKVVSPAQTTTYKLTASNGGGSSSAAVTVSVTSASDTQAPAAPTLVSAIAKSPTQVALTWTGSTDNVGVAGYQIVRNGLVITSVPGGVRSYSDNGAASSASYIYFVKAYDAAGNYSAASNSVQVTTPASIASGGCPAPAAGAFTGCYYNNTTLTGSPVFTRTDRQINFEWAYGPPDASVTPGNFSVRWQGNFSFDAGTYTFSAIVSDGMRVYIDGNIVLDKWRDQAASMYTAVQTLRQGNHLVTVEYYERTGWPAAHLSWQKK